MDEELLVDTDVMLVDEPVSEVDIVRVESETKAISELLQDPTKALNVKLSQKIIEHVDNSETVDGKISDTAESLVDTALETQQNKATANRILSENDIDQADFEKNQAEYLYHGIDHKVDKRWKRRLLFFINDIWFVIWAIISAFTIVPVSTFLSRIKALSGSRKA